MDPGSLDVAIQDRVHKTGKKSKAIIIIHLYGMPAKMEELMAVAHKYGIFFIEDAAEGLGGRYKDKPLFGYMGFFFQQLSMLVFCLLRSARVKKRIF